MNKDFCRMVGQHLVTEEAKHDRSMLTNRVLLACIAGFLVYAVIYSATSRAVQLDHQQCQGYAVWTHDIVLMRDVGADKEKVRAYLESKKDEIPFFSMLLKELDKLWASKGDRAEAGAAIYQDCVKRRGQYGTDV